MNPQTTSVNPSLCPLCQKPNLCVMASPKADDSPPQRCWCMDATFTPELLAKIPDTAKHKACVCADCAKNTG